MHRLVKYEKPILKNYLSIALEEQKYVICLSVQGEHSFNESITAVATRLYRVEHRCSTISLLTCCCRLAVLVHCTGGFGLATVYGPGWIFLKPSFPNKHQNTLLEFGDTSLVADKFCSTVPLTRGENKNTGRIQT